VGFRGLRVRIRGPAEAMLRPSMTTAQSEIKARVERIMRALRSKCERNATITGLGCLVLPWSRLALVAKRAQRPGKDE